MIFLALVLRFLEAMAEFPKTWALLQGGPGTATETLPVYIFLTTWQYFEISKGAAMSYIVMLMMIVIVLLAIRLLRREKQSLDAMYAAARQAAGMMRQVPASANDCDRALCRAHGLGCRRVLPDLLDDLDLVQAGYAVVRLAAGLLPASADAGELSQRLVRRRGVCRHAVRDLLAEAADLAARTRPSSPAPRRCLSVLFGSVIAYGVSRYRILSETRMFQLLMLRMIPPIVIVAPLSLYYSTLGLLDSMIGLDPHLFPHARCLTRCG